MYERIAKLVARLYEKTNANQIAWKKSPSGEFQASFPHYTVEISTDNYVDVYLRIYNDEGDILDVVSNKNLASRAESGDSGLILDHLYDMARRAALGSDKAIDELISALED